MRLITKGMILWSNVGFLYFVTKIKKLAFYDVALDIYSIRRYFSSLSTTFADIELNLDDLSVSDRRDDLIETLRKNQLKNPGARKIYIA